MADETETVKSGEGWMNDVQRAIALILIGSLAACTLMSTVMAVFIGDPGDALVDMVKTLQAAVVNMCLIALGFFFGSNMSKVLADAGQQKIVEKLTSTNPPTGGPVAPLAAPVIVPWWAKLTDLEKNVISANAKDDARVAAFMTTAASGAATPDDLDYLVGKGLLEKARADEIKS